MMLPSTYAVAVIRFIMIFGIMVSSFPITTNAQSAAPRTTTRAGGALVGTYTSIALNSDGAPVISYVDFTDSVLKLAICDDDACTTPTISTIDSIGNTDGATSVALTAADIPIIAYYDAINKNLLLAMCNDASCSSPSFTTVDSVGDVGSDLSMTLTSAELPVISYYDATNTSLKVAICNNAACDTPRIATVDNSASVGTYSSVEVTSADYPVISYYDATNLNLKIAICDTTDCTGVPLTKALDSTGDVGQYTSLVLTSADIPIVSYYDATNTNPKIAICADATCTSNTTRVLENTVDDAGQFTSIALTSDEQPVVSYYDATNKDLKVVECYSTSCISPPISYVDSIGDVGKYNSIALTADNRYIISYYDETNGNLTLKHEPTTVDLGQPNTFGKLTPSTNGTISSTSTTLTWDPISNADSYEYCVATSVAACTSWVSAGTDTSASITGLTHNTNYYWQVRATNTLGTTLADLETHWRFRVIIAPASFAKKTPRNNAKNQKTTLTLTWAASTRATSYEYCIALSTSACTNWKSTGTRTSVVVRGLATNKNYFWQVRAKNASGTTVSSSTFWKFTTAATRRRDLEDANEPLQQIAPKHDNEQDVTVPSDSSFSATTTPISARTISVGWATSLALTSAGVPVISHRQYGSGGDPQRLKFAACNNSACETPTTAYIDEAVGSWYSSIKVTSADIPVMAYYDSTNGDLKLAVCDDVACANPTTSTLDGSIGDDTNGNVGHYPSLALTSADVPVISYYNASTDDLKLAICNDATCSSYTIRQIDTTGDVGMYTSIALTASDVPIISYYENTNKILKLAICDDAACASPTISTIDNDAVNDVGRYASIGLTSADIPIISYYDNTNKDLKLAVCNDTACSAPTLSTLDSTGTVGEHTSIAITSTDVPMISYYDNTNGNLKMVVCDDADCLSPTLSILDSTLIVGLYISMALNADDVPVISYYDLSNEDLKLYHGPTIIDYGQPNSFAKATPTTNAIVAGSAATLTWGFVLNNEGYEYCVATSIATCTSWVSTGSDQVANVTGLSHNTTYFWQVRATNSIGTTLADGGSFGRFRIVYPPASFNKTSPANNAKNQPTRVTLKWAASARATSYEYCIALTQATCTNWKSTGTKTTIAVSGLAKGKTYFWQVRAKNAGTTTISSGGYRKFTTKR